MIERLAATIPLWAWSIAIGAGAILAALALHWLIFRIARRTTRHTDSVVDDVFVQRLCRPARWLLIVLALRVVQPALALDETGAHLWTAVAGLLIPALFGWAAIALLGAATEAVKLRANIDVEDNLQARRKRTRADILHRIGVVAIGLITLCLMLMTIPAVRSVGVTLVASAGLAALAVGAAAQPALKNLIAGLQMAFTEPIRLDDVVIIDGEWGRIEEIRLTYVVVKIWDERRLVVPVSKFLEDSFQNWTRQTSQILGSVFWYLDPATDVDRMRAKLEELVTANSKWDKRFFNLQVTDTKADSIEVRGLMTAQDASRAFDLRCDVREGMLAWLRAEMPEAFPRRREDVSLTRPESSDPAPARV